MWWLKTENGNLWMLVDGFKATKKNGDLYTAVLKIRAAHNKTHLKIFLSDGLTSTIRRDKFLHTGSDDSKIFENVLDNNSEFVEVFKSNFEKQENTFSPAAHYSKNRSSVLDESIVKKAILGTYEVDIRQLEEPSPDTQLRKVDSKFVHGLKNGILRSHASSYVPVFPVNCISLKLKDDFKESDIASYKFQTLGGNHLREALSQIAEADEEREHTQLVKIYVGLTASEALRVATDHNARTHFRRKTSFFEEASLCRRTLKELPGDITKQCILDKDWRENCQAMLCREKQSLESLELTFQVAGYSHRCWEKTEIIDGLFRAQNTKGQKKRDDTKTVSQVPFMHLQGLPEEEKFDLLSQVADGLITVKDMMSAADLRKKKKTVKQKMMQCFRGEVNSWDDALRKYPEHTSDEAIVELCKLNFPKEKLPAELVEHCEHAKRFANENVDDIKPCASKTVVTKINDMHAYASNISDISSREVLNAGDEYTLIYVEFEQNESQHMVIKTIKSLKALSVNLIIAAFGTWEQLAFVKTFCTSNQMTTERIFQYSTSFSSNETSSVLLDHVLCGLICFQSGNDRLDIPSHSNLWRYDSRDFQRELMRKFTKAGDWFIQCVGEKTEVCVDAITEGRKLFIFSCDPKRHIDLIQRHFETKVPDSDDAVVDDNADANATAAAATAAATVAAAAAADDDDEPLAKYRKK